MGKMQAEVVELRAKAEFIAAQADDLVSTRLIRELDRLSLVNDHLSQAVEHSRLEIDKLRNSIREYADREQRHVQENQMLRAELGKFTNADSVVKLSLMAIYPPVIEHEPSEFDPPPENESH